MTSNPTDSDVFVPVTDADDTDLPQFATVIRGYDRGQVDDYVTRLKDFVADAERRAELAERTAAEASRRAESASDELRQVLEQPSTQYEGLGERIESILRLASEEADAIRHAARADIERLNEEAQRRRDESVQAAERELRQVMRRRDNVVEELRRVQEALATLGLRPPAPALDDPYPAGAEASRVASDDTVVVMPGRHMQPESAVQQG